MKQNGKSMIFFWGLLALLAVYVGFVISNLFEGGKFDAERMNQLQAMLLHPGSLKVTEQTPLCIVVLLLVWFCALAYYLSAASLNRMPGKEYGTAKWMNWQSFNRHYMKKTGKGAVQNTGNRILSEHIRVNRDARETERNNNQIIVGGSGSGKTAFILSPNLLNNLEESSVFTDPKGLIC